MSWRPPADEPQAHACDQTLKRELDLYGDELEPGALAGAYVIEQREHQGGFATLYRARHLGSGRAAAIKLMHQQLTRSPQLLKRFKQEAETLVELRHPNIVELFEYGELRDGRPFLAMEWLPGRNLREELKARGSLSAKEALQVMEEVGAALGAAHHRGVVHRDLKAENVMAVPEGAWFRAKVVDFGLVKWTAERLTESQLTSTGMVLGTPVAMAPEQIRGQAPDARTDIYALGLLLYQLVTGRVPFEELAAVEIEEMHLKAPPPRPSELAPVARAFDAVVLRCLEKERQRRYATVEELLGELRQAVAAPAAPALRAAAGLYVQSSLALDLELAGSEAALDELEQALETALAVCRREGLQVTLRSTSGFLAASPLPADSESARAARKRLLCAGLGITDQLRSRPAASAAVRLSVTLHVAPALVGHGAGGSLELSGGELMQIAEWAGPHDAGMFATAAAAADLEGFVLAAVPGRSGLFRLASDPTADS